MTTITGIDDAGKDMAQRVGNPVIYNMPAAASYSGAQTYLNTDLIGGIIVHNTGGAGVNGTLPTAALMRAALSQFGSPARVGDTIYCLIVNGGSAGSITLIAGSGGSFDTNQVAGSQVIATLTSKTVLLRMTNVTPGSEAYTIYS
jgi:hypothetical protein